MSEKDCQNDCTTPLRFPRRPGTLMPASHKDDCPCCTADTTRVSNDNRPALSHFNYRIGTYGSIREFLFSRHALEFRLFQRPIFDVESLLLRQSDVLVDGLGTPHNLYSTIVEFSRHA